MPSSLQGSRDYTRAAFKLGSARTRSAVAGPRLAGPTPVTGDTVTPSTAAVNFATALTSGLSNRAADQSAADTAARTQAANDATAAQQTTLRGLQIDKARADLAPKPEKPEKVVPRVPIMSSDWTYLLGKKGVPSTIQQEYLDNGGTLSAEGYKSFQAAVDNQRSTDNAARAATAAMHGVSNDDLKHRAETILHGIATGTLDPNIEAYATSREAPLRSMLAEGAVNMGLDLQTLRQNWYANRRGLSSANSPQQLRMRQAIQTIPDLLAQMRGYDRPDGTHVDGVIDQLNATANPMYNWIAQKGKELTGHAGALKEYKIVAAKLANEQAFMTSGGNQPHKDVVNAFMHQYESYSNPNDILDALDRVEHTTQTYQQAISQTGPVGPSSPYVPGQTNENPIGGPTFNMGTNPAAGTHPPASAARPGYIRIAHGDGTPADWPQGQPIPAGWAQVK